MRGWFIVVAGVLVACEPGGNGKVGDKSSDTSTPLTTTGVATGSGTPSGNPTGTSTGSTATGTGSGTGTGTGTATGTSVAATVSATCAPTANPLRFACDVTVTPPQEVDVTFWITGTTEEYTLSSEDIANYHQVILYMMKADTDYEWRAAPRNAPAVQDTGYFTSGSLSGGCQVDTVINGTTSAPYIVTQSPCVTDANMVVIDQDGDVVWCEDFSPTAIDPMMEGSNFTEDGTFIAVLADHIIEKDLEGTELLRLARGVDFAEHAHHDVWRKDGLTYVLFNEQVNHNNYNYTLDGFYVFDQNTQLGEWHLIDHFQPANAPIGWPGQDYSHSNAVWVDDQGDLLLSMRHLSAFVSVNADPYDPYFGTINYRVAGGGPSAEFGSDYTITTSVGGLPDFERQHNTNFMSNGDIALFDNRDGIAELSRLLHLQLNNATMEADIVGAYTLPNHCDFQGGAWTTGIGNPMATCAPIRKAFEWDVGQTTSRWDMSVSCSTGLNTYTPRFQPWEGPF